MARRFRRVMLGVMLFGVTIAGRVGAVAPKIKDDGKYFSAGAVKEANEQIREIARKYDKDLLIETFASVPTSDLDKVKAMSAQDRSKYFGKWTAERTEAAVVNGVYVLVCREPTYLYVAVTAKARSDFDTKARAKLSALLLKEFPAKRFDEGLKAAVRFAQDTFAESSKRNPFRSP